MKTIRILACGVCLVASMCGSGRAWEVTTVGAWTKIKIADNDETVTAFKSAIEAVARGDYPNKKCLLFGGEFLSKESFVFNYGSQRGDLPLTSEFSRDAQNMLKEVESVWISYDRLSYEGLDEQLSFFKTLPNLKKININCSAVSKLPDVLFDMRKIEELNLDKMKEIKEIPEAITNLDSLTRLTLRSSVIIHVPDALVDKMMQGNLIIDGLAIRKSLGEELGPLLGVVGELQEKVAQLEKDMEKQRSEIQRFTEQLRQFGGR